MNDIHLSITTLSTIITSDNNNNNNNGDGDGDGDDGKSGNHCNSYYRSRNYDSHSHSSDLKLNKAQQEQEQQQQNVCKYEEEEEEVKEQRKENAIFEKPNVNKNTAAAAVKFHKNHKSTINMHNYCLLEHCSSIDYSHVTSNNSNNNNNNNNNKMLSDVHFQRGYSLMSQKLYGMAIAEFSHAIAYNPHHKQAYGLRGILLHKSMNKLIDAIQDYSSALHLCPTDIQLLFFRGCTLFFTSHFREALKDFSKLVHLLSNRDEKYNTCNNTHYHHGTENNSNNNYSSTGHKKSNFLPEPSMTPESTEEVETIIHTSCQKKRKSRKQMIVKHSSFLNLVHLWRSKSLMAIGDYNEAIIELEHLLKWHPNNSEIHFSLDVCYYKKKKKMMMRLT